MSSQQIACRLVAAPDLGGVAAMYRELQAYHGYAQDSLESLSEQLRSMDQSFEIVVAEQEGRLLGFALFSAYPGPGLHSGMFLKELFVTAEARGLGVGKRLMASLAAIAQERGYQRIDLTTQTNNAPARAFYERLGGRQDQARVFYRFDAQTIEAIAEDALDEDG